MVGSLSSSCRYKGFLSCIGCSSRASKYIFFLTVHYFHSFVPSPSRLGRQSCQVACSLMCFSEYGILSA
jgi:hypothetical protein